MSSNKRQKVDSGQGTQLLSAAALRRRLLEKQASTSASPAKEGNERSRGASTCVPDEKNGVQGDDILVKGDSSRTFEEVLLGAFGAATAGDDLYGTSEVLEDPPKRKILQLSSFKPNKENLKTRSDGIAVLRFAGAERLVILGSYGIRLKAGEATISGASLYPSDVVHWVHAPHCHALPVLRCSEQSIVELHSHPSTYGLRRLERLSPIFGSLWSETANGESTKQTWQILSTSADGPKRAFLQELKSPAEWNKQLADVIEPNKNICPVLMICGPKSSGKSTFSRLVTNRLITCCSGKKGRIWPGVAILDIDPGQPEFSPPGVVSLVLLEQPTLAPPFCHPLVNRRHLRKCHAVASITPASDIEHYKACVIDLYRTYKATCPKYPLVINTPGWIQGSGLVLLTDLISEVTPTNIIYMSQEGPQDTVESLKSAGQSIKFSTLPSQSIEYASRTALQLRHMQAMSYLHVDSHKDHKDELQWNPAPISSTPPKMASYDANGGGIVAVVCYGYQPDPELLAEAINGTIVAIVAVEDNGKDMSPVEDAIRKTPGQIPYIYNTAPLKPQSSQCLGLALVRGIDQTRQIIALSTPVPIDQLQDQRVVLVSGKFDPPIWAYTEDHYNRTFNNKDGGGEMGGDTSLETQVENIPWVEKLHGSQKRATGSKVWRVRRDLGRNNSATGD